MEILLTNLRAVGEKTRLRIIALLGRGELVVTDLVSILGQSQPRVSRHLKILMEAGLVERHSEGTWAFFRLSNKGVSGVFVQKIVDNILKEDKTVLSDLRKLTTVRERRAQEAISYFEKVAQNWNSIRSLYVSEDRVEEEIAKILKRYTINSLLDIGTGTGRILEVFSKMFKRGLGIDNSKHMLAIARESLNKKNINNCFLQLGNMYHLEIDNQSQDAIIFHQVLHFAENLHEVFDEASRVLTKDGVLIIADFSPHREDILRDEHNHRRLGFEEFEISEYGKNAALTQISCQHLQGNKLTVSIWEFTK